METLLNVARPLIEKKVHVNLIETYSYAKA